MDKIWVELAASGSTAHGPTLRIRLVSDHHPAVQAASRAVQAASRAVQAASEADYAQRAQRAERVFGGQPAAEALGDQQASWLSAFAALAWIEIFLIFVVYQVGGTMWETALLTASMHAGW